MPLFSAHLASFLQAGHRLLLVSGDGISLSQLSVNHSCLKAELQSWSSRRSLICAGSLRPTRSTLLADGSPFGAAKMDHQNQRSVDLHIGEHRPWCLFCVRIATATRKRFTPVLPAPSAFGQCRLRIGRGAEVPQCTFTWLSFRPSA